MSPYKYDRVEKDNGLHATSNELDDGHDLPDPDALDGAHRFSSLDRDRQLSELDPLNRDDSEDSDDSTRIKSRRRAGTATSNGEQSFAYAAHKRTFSLPHVRLRRWMFQRRVLSVVAIGAVVLFLSLMGGGGVYVYKKGTIHGESPPWYPSPRGGTSERWRESYEAAALMVNKMTLAEKVNVTTGTGWMMGPCVGNTGPALNVGFPGLCLQDGPLGIRFADHITATPAGITVGATWNKDLMYKRGSLLGVEARAKGINVLLGPSVGPLGRMPAGGRNWEGFGPDPVLQGIAAAETIKGIQKEGVMATIKHFVGNEQEHFRQAREWGLPNAISSNIGDRTLHELYAWPFADAIKAGVASVMCSYNQVNNSYACQNSKLMNGILKDELGFQGFVQSDWLAQRSGVDSALSGLDMSMPGDGSSWANGESFWGPQLSRAALNGSVPMDRLNDMVTRILASFFQVGQDDAGWFPPGPPWGDGGPNFSSWTDDETGLLYPGSDDPRTGIVNKFVDAPAKSDFSHKSLVRRIAAEGTVLLKNKDTTLPLSRNGWPRAVQNAHKDDNEPFRLAIVGEDAKLPEDGPNSCADRGCNKGTLASGWGSGAVEFPYLVSPMEAIEESFRRPHVELASFLTNSLPSKVNPRTIRQQDACIVFVNADAGEGFISSGGIKGDRNDLRLQKDGDNLINDVVNNCGSQNPRGKGKVIVVIHSVGPVLVESFIDHVDAVLLANLPGQESGHALVDVLLGHVNPSGRLPYTIGKSLKDYGPGAQVMYLPNGVIPQQTYDEGAMIDYRWFDVQNIQPRFEFGYGLSYTTFALKDMVVGVPPQRPGELPPPRPPPQATPPEYPKTRPDKKEIEFPEGLSPIKKYIYPYITDIASEVDLSSHYEYSPPQHEPASESGGGEGGNPGLYEVFAKIKVTVVNEGDVSGQAVVQLYVSFPEEIWEEYEVVEAAPNGADGAAGVVPAAEQIGGGSRDGLQRDAGRVPPDSNSDSDAGPKAGPEAPRIWLDDLQKRQHADAVPLLPAFTPPPRPPPPGPPEDPGPPPEPPKKADEPEFQISDPHFSEPIPADRPRARERIYTPKRVLRAFEKVHTYVKPPFSAALSNLTEAEFYKKHPFTLNEHEVRFEVTRRDLSYWSVRKQNWVFPRGAFKLEVGFSSRDIRVGGTVFE